MNDVLKIKRKSRLIYQAKFRIFRLNKNSVTLTPFYINTVKYERVTSMKK